MDIPNKKFDLPQHHGDGSALPMLIQSGNLSLAIGSPGGCRLNSYVEYNTCVEVNSMRWRNDIRVIKSALFSRPVIIYKKLSHGFYFVIPTTTQKKKGSWFVHVRYQRTDMTACLHQSRAIDHRCLSSRLGQLDGDDFENVQSGFRKLYK